MWNGGFRHVLERGQVLVAEDQDLVGPERLAQRLRGGVGNRLGQVYAGDLGAGQGAGGMDLVPAGQGLGHVLPPRNASSGRDKSCLFDRIY